MKQWYELDISKGILAAKYFHDGEDFEGFLNRVSGMFSPETGKKLKEAMRKSEFFPAGRILYGAGLNEKGTRATLQNCYTIASPKDSIEGIFKSCREMARTFSYGGGVGVNISTLRPNGAKVNNSAKTSTGAVSFMPILDSIGGVIGSNNRRSALMVGLNCNHPDLYEFLKIKEDNVKLASMNISVLFTDDFWRAIKENKPWKLSFTIPETGEKIERTIDARKFYHEFCEVNFHYGDPGCMNIDTINKNHLLSGYPEYQIHISNPCFHGDDVLLTTEGYKKFKDLAKQKTATIITPEGRTVYNCPVWKTGTKHVITLKVGLTKKSVSDIVVTPDHKFLTINNTFVEAKDLKKKQLQFPLLNYLEQSGLNIEAAKLGFMQGDGTYHHKKDRTQDGYSVYLGDKDSDVRDLLFSDCINQETVGYGYMVKNGLDLAKKAGIKDEYLRNRTLPTNLLNQSQSYIDSFLRGLFSANGSVISVGKGKVRIGFKSTCLELINQLIDLLKNRGIYSYYTINRKHQTEFTNGIYECKESYDLNISRVYDQILFYQQIGFIQKYKSEKLYNALKNEKIKVIDIVDDNQFVDVYDFTESNKHLGVVNGVVAHNCSEFMGIDYAACCLGSINLYECVKNKFTDKADIDWNKLNELTRLGVDVLNEVLDKSIDSQPLKENAQVIKDWRNIGLGFFGLADALIALGFRYGSDDAVNITRGISCSIMQTALTRSNELAKKYGTFDKYDKEKTMESWLLQQNMLFMRGCAKYCSQEDIERYGLRNGSLISIAPGGSLSLIAGGLCGGIEPFFKVSYTRTTHKGEDEGIKFRVFPRSIQELLEYHKLPLTMTNEEIKQRFPFIVEADEIPYQERIKMQAAVQNHIDNAISSTVNLPNSATIEDIEKIYEMAYDYGLKGITVFRDGCKRLSILNVDNNKDKKEEKPKTEKMIENYGNIVPVKRTDKALNSLTYKLQSACTKLYITITADKNNKPFEVFVSPSSGCTANIATICRLTSTMLRCGVAPKVVIDELTSNKCPACQQLIRQGKKGISHSCGNAIGDALKDFCKNLNIFSRDKQEIKVSPKPVDKEETKTEQMKCPECGEKLHAEGKCIACSNCGWSKCE